MSIETQQQIRSDLAVIERFANTYREQFSQLIRELNNDPTPQTGRRCLRLCVEAVNMLLDTQNHLANALRTMNEPACR